MRHDMPTDSTSTDWRRDLNVVGMLENKRGCSSTSVVQLSTAAAYIIMSSRL